MDIIEELRQNRESGARRLVIEYKAGLMVVARRFYLNESDAEEAVNATFAKIIENINGFLEQSSLFTWMCQILVNEFRKSVRRKSNRMEILPDEMPEVEDDTACKAIYDNLDATLLRNAIDELPEDVRKTLVMHYFMDFSVKDVARLLAIPAGTVKRRLFYARKILAVKLGAAAEKAKAAAKTPVGKALLLALALCGLTALGAAVYSLAFSGEAQDRRTTEDAGDVSNFDSNRQQSTASDPSGSTGSAASTPSAFDFGRSTFDQPTQEITTMNATTLRSLAASAAIAAATGAAISARADSAEPFRIRHLADSYLQSDGTQAINLEYYANPKTRVEVVFEPVSTNGTSYVFGSAFSSASDFQEGLYMQNGEVNFICGDLWSGTGNAWGLGSGVKATQSRFTAILDVKGSSAMLKSGDSIVWSKAIASTRTKTDNIPLHVFANPHPYRESGSLVLNPRDFASVKLFSLAVWDDDVLVRDLVPYGRGAVTGLLDRCSGKVFTNSRSEANPFILGTDDGYIRSDRLKNGGQWLDTGCRAGPGTKIEVDFAMLATNVQQRIFGAGSENMDGLLTDFYVNGGGEFAYAWQNDTGTGAWTTTGVKADSERHVFTVDSPGGSVHLTDAKGRTLYSATLSTARSKSGAANLRLFGGVVTNGIGGIKNWNNSASVRIYGVKIWENGVLAHKFTPRIVDGVDGLYDTEDGVFHGAEVAKPSSALQAGGAIECAAYGTDTDGGNGDAYIEATGDQYIDTGFKPTKNTRIDIDFSTDTLTDTRFAFGAIANSSWSGAPNVGIYRQNRAIALRFWNGSATKTWGMKGNGTAEHKRYKAVIDQKNAKAYWFEGGTADGENTPEFGSLFSVNVPIWLLAGQYGGTGGYGYWHGRLYSCDIYEDGDLKHSYTPCAMNGVAGLWDTVDGVFLGNARTADGSGFTLHGAGACGSGMAFKENPQDARVSRDTTVTLSAYAPGAVGYLWLKNGEIVEGATGRTLEVSYGRGGTTDEYRCLAHYNLFGYGISDTARVENIPAALVISVR